MNGVEQVREFLKRFDHCEFCDLYAKSKHKDKRITTKRGDGYMVVKIHNYKVKYCPECGKKL